MLKEKMIKWGKGKEKERERERERERADIRINRKKWRRNKERLEILEKNVQGKNRRDGGRKNRDLRRIEKEKEEGECRSIFNESVVSRRGEGEQNFRRFKGDRNI